jgi:hypothetical protein
VSSPRIAIEWECLSNLGQEQAFSARLLLRNVGDAAIKPGWSVYFNTCRKLDPASVSAGYVVEHVNGDLFRLCEPGAPAWLPGQAHDIAYNGAPWAIGIADAPLGFFLVTAPGMRPVDLGDPVVAPFEREEQLQRHGGDAAPVMDAARRYADNAALTLLESEQVGRLTPRPASARWLPGALTLGPASQVGHAPELAAEADLLRAWLAGLPAASGSAAVTLETGPLEFVGAAPSEAYRLEAGAGGVTIRGGAHGVFNALQTLRQLAGAGSVPYCVVEDAPRFAYRGQMLDVARHFVGKGALMRLLDCMARYKLNRFHFHLTDDEGWRLAIAALPELTEVGARRGVPAGTPCLPPSFGSGADVEASAGTGYYTRADFIEILRYAHARHIEVIPEFNLPGHARAAVVAMQVRAARLRAARDPDPERHLLSDPGDASVYESVQLWRDNVICIARPSVDRFLDTVVGEVVAMYREAGAPLRAVHTGGDEVPAGAWRGSPLCRARMVEHGWTSVEQLHEDFLDRCRTVLRATAWRSPAGRRRRSPAARRTAASAACRTRVSRGRTSSRTPGTTPGARATRTARTGWPMPAIRWCWRTPPACISTWPTPRIPRSPAITGQASSRRATRSRCRRSISPPRRPGRRWAGRYRLKRWPRWRRWTRRDGCASPACRASCGARTPAPRRASSTSCCRACSRWPNGPGRRTPAGAGSPIPPRAPRRSRATGTNSPTASASASCRAWMPGRRRSATGCRRPACASRTGACTPTSRCRAWRCITRSTAARRARTVRATFAPSRRRRMRRSAGSPPSIRAAAPAASSHSTLKEPADA